MFAFISHVVCFFLYCWITNTQLMCSTVNVWVQLSHTQTHSPLTFELHSLQCVSEHTHTSSLQRGTLLSDGRNISQPAWGLCPSSQCWTLSQALWTKVGVCDMQVTKTIKFSAVSISMTRGGRSYNYSCASCLWHVGLGVIENIPVQIPVL